MSKMGTVMSCRDGGRNCFHGDGDDDYNDIDGDDDSRYGEQVSFGSSGWNHPHIPHPVFVPASSYFHFCLLVLLFFILVLLSLCLHLFPDDVSHGTPTSYTFVSVSSSFSKSFLFTAPLRNNLLNGHSLPL